MKYRLPLILAAGFLLRVFIPIGKVFSGGYVNFLGPDSYYHADVMRQGLAVFPHLQGSFYDWLVVGISWVIGLGHPSVNLMEHVSIFVPPLLALGVIYFVYVMGRRLFGVGAGLFAALLAAVLPGEFFARSLLGAIDHHAFEVFITTAAACIVIVALTQKKPFIWWKLPIYAAGVLLCMVIYRYSWLGAAQVFNQIKSLSFLSPAVMFTESTITTTTETISALNFPNYLPLLNVALGIIGGLILWRRGKGWRRYMVIAWAFFMAAVSLWQVRFDYYLIVPVALLFGFMASEFCRKESFKSIKVIIAVVCILAVLPVYIGKVDSGFNTPSKAWNDALIWLRDNTPHDAVILAWWDYGYWIRYRAERTPYLTPSQEFDKIPDIARLFLSYEDMLPPISADYVVIDYKAAYFMEQPMSVWAGLDYRDIDGGHTLIQRLYEGWQPPGYSFVYRNSELVIYEVDE